MRYAWAIVMSVLPSSLKRRLWTRLYGWDIHPTAYIGRSVIIVRHLSMGPGASIGPRNVIRNLEVLQLDEGAQIATQNSIIGWPLDSDVFPNSPNRDPSLYLERHAMITVDHQVDCCDRVRLHQYATIAGFRSQILTHSLNLVRDRQETGPVDIGERSALMSGCIVLSGTGVPPRSIVSAGSVITTKLTKDLTFYRGNPAEAIRPLPDRLMYFRRGEPGHPATAADPSAG